jgi:IS1 family transposase
MIPKLSGTCIAVRSMFHISSTNTLKSIYFAYFHSIIKYGIVFWGNSSNSRKIFTLQKKIVRLMVGAHHRNPCRRLFKKLEILPVPCPYIFSLMIFFVNNQENFQTNSSVHRINTSNKHHLHRPVASLSCFQKSPFFSGIRIFNSLPCSLTNLKNEKAPFKVSLRSSLNGHSFYSVGEFLCVLIMYNNDF